MSGIKHLASAALAIAAIGITALSSGCSYSGDTSGYQAEQKRSKAEIMQAIDQVNADTKMPAGVKQTALAQLNKELADAH
ncbi:hypothetical protein CCAX7_002840 [Capsulimonas corticalis]|uniref:Uncharacterized protein n=1 Tax=Capsulimonas corticalis TaxID=2219043 RepID=A0A402CS26_9BACT|nr:hypothetical protein [Capsulimonas corticalis]BDI28233.1 hypothetical protein CCAX7_002840 [Capsulimonas corticalis]